MSRFHLRANFYLVALWHLRSSWALCCRPYQTVAMLAHHRHWWLVFTPAVYYILLLLIWRFLLRAPVQQFVPANCFLMMIKTSIVFFTLYWQISLLYLSIKLKLWSPRKGNHG